MSDRTPTTENILNCYVYASEGYDGSLAIPERQSKAEFDRWLAEVERAAAAKALNETADDLERANASPNLIELECRYSGFYSGIRQTTAGNVEKLRTRAAALGVAAGQEGEAE